MNGLLGGPIATGQSTTKPRELILSHRKIKMPGPPCICCMFRVVLFCFNPRVIPYMSLKGEYKVLQQHGVFASIPCSDIREAGVPCGGPYEYDEPQWTEGWDTGE